jgi:enamine deaminase RidA (YjgF/YER057c/UK114 family)
MPSKTPVLTTGAPPPLPGILSQAIIANGVVYCSGSVAISPETLKLVDSDVGARTVSFYSLYPRKYLFSD